MRDQEEATGLTEIGELYPDFTDEELVIAKANLRRYAEALLRIAGRLQAEGKSTDDVR